MKLPAIICRCKKCAAQRAMLRRLAAEASSVKKPAIAKQGERE